MRRGVFYTGLIAAWALALTGCGIADRRSPVPEFMRGSPVDPSPPEPAPDVRQLVRKDLGSMFTAASNPQQVRVSRPLHAPSGPGWIACVRADLTSVMGKPLGAKTYRITISGGIIVDRLQVQSDDNCATESYDPI